MKKYSRQREALLTELRARKDHPTAEELYLGLRAIMPNYSLGTVYRNLSELCANGYILKIETAGGAERYDGCITPHGHFACVKCGRVFDLDGIYEKHIDKGAIIKEISESESCGAIRTVQEIRLMLYGICRTCDTEK